MKEYHEYGVNSEEFTEQERNYDGMRVGMRVLSIGAQLKLALLQVFHDGSIERVECSSYNTKARPSFIFAVHFGRS